MTSDGPGTVSGSLEPAASFGPAWFTPPAAAVVAPWGWIPLDDTYEVAWLVDQRYQLPGGLSVFARLMYRAALDVAQRERAALISREQVIQIQEQSGIAAPPIALPDDAIRSSASGSLARRDGETQATWDQRLRGAGMTSLSWALHHDARFWARVGRWPAGELVAGAGKHWIRGAPKGYAFLFGWWNGAKWIQTAPPEGTATAFHDDGHHDYATTTILVRRRDGAPMNDHGSGSAGWVVAALAAGTGALVIGLRALTRRKRRAA
jgi:hypothetical protein